MARSLLMKRCARVGWLQPDDARQEKGFEPA